MSPVPHGRRTGSKIGFGTGIGGVLLTAILLGVFVITVYPFVHMLVVSISDPTEVMRNRVTIFPKGFTTVCYRLVFQNTDFIRSYLNTVIYTTVGVLINLTLTIMTAYPLSRAKFPGRRFFSQLIIFTMLFSGGMIPTYLVVMNLGLIDTIWAVVLPVAINTMNLMILRTNFQGIPSELEEAATIDGCNDFQALWLVFLPLSKTILLTLGLFYTVGHWNAFFIPFLYLNSKAKYPVQILLRGLLIEGQFSDYASAWSQETIISTTIKYATVMVTTLPILCIYPFIQRYFTKGVLMGSLKG